MFDIGQHKILIIDGIAGVPLGRELYQSMRDAGLDAAYFDALHESPRRFHSVRSALSKVGNKLQDGDGFTYLPRLDISRLEALVRQERPSHVLVVGFLYKHFSVSQTKAVLSREGIRLALYDTDSCNLYSKRREFVYFIEEELPFYDEIFSFSQVTTRFFRDTLKLNARYLPFGAFPVEGSSNLSGKEHDVVFVGSADLRRIFLLENVQDRVLVRGNRWGRNMALMSEGLRAHIDNRPIWGAELLELLQRSRIVLNITRSDFFGAETGVNLRIFEALAAGCFLLTDYCEEISELFKPGEEIEVFRSGKELKEKVEYYLAHDAERERIARCGQERFLRDHTWAVRVEQLRQAL